MPRTPEPNHSPLDEFDSDVWASRQSLAWLQGRRSIISEIIRENPELGNDKIALLELIDNELELRRQSGEIPILEEYQLRFPQLRDALKIHWEISRLLIADAPIDSDGALELLEGTPARTDCIGSTGQPSHGIGCWKPDTIPSSGRLLRNNQLNLSSYR